MGTLVTVAELVFYLFAGIAIATALGVVMAPNVVHAALFLIGSLVSVAAFYILLSSEFLALMQILVYAGGVATIVLFGLMLTRSSAIPRVSVGAQWPLAFLVTSILALALIVGVVDTEWPRDVGEVTLVNVQTLGNALFTTWVLPVILVAIVLDVALTGAILLSRPEEGEA